MPTVAAETVGCQDVATATGAPEAAGNVCADLATPSVTAGALVDVCTIRSKKVNARTVWD